MAVYSIKTVQKIPVSLETGLGFLFQSCKFTGYYPAKNGF